MPSLSETPTQIVFFADGRLDVENASIYTGLSKKTMAMARCNGTGAKYVKRGKIFYFKEDLDEWLNANGRHTSTAAAKHAELAKRGKLSPLA
jgi:hypothetical protein